jgi:hypothetical protein
MACADRLTNIRYLLCFMDKLMSESQPAKDLGRMDKDMLGMHLGFIVLHLAHALAMVNYEGVSTSCCMGALLSMGLRQPFCSPQLPYLIGQKWARYH